MTAGTHTVLIATSGTGIAESVATLSALGDPVTVLAVGPADVAEAASASGAADVARLATDVPAEALALRVADEVAALSPDVVASTTDAAGRALLGAVGARLGAGSAGRVTALRRDGDRIVLERPAVAGAVVETLTATAPVAVVLGAVAGAAEPRTTTPVATRELAADGVAGFALAVTGRRPKPTPSGIADASRVVSIGRGVRARDDVAEVEKLAAALGAELGCSMPIADDLGWVEQARYVGRSGQRISPALYVAVGISGAPQHLEGIRGAKTVVAINTDRDAAIFRRADYGIVGDLYEVVPALVAALAEH